MDFWNKKINVSKEAAEQQIAIINTFSSEKRMKIALDFANLSLDRTREWIKRSKCNCSENAVKQSSWTCPIHGQITIKGV